MNILFIYADNEREWNTSQWRCVNPANAINAYDSPDEAKTIFYQSLFRDQSVADLVRWADLVVFERLVIGIQIERIIDMQAIGKIIVADLDDGYHYMPQSVGPYRFWHEGYVMVERDGKQEEVKLTVPPVEQLVWGVKFCNALTSPSKLILDDWKKYNKNIYLMPNYIPTEMYLPSKRGARTQEERDGRFIIGWGGSWSHLESWKESAIIPAIRTILNKHQHVILRIAGGDARVIEAINMPGRVFSTGWTSLKDWSGVLAEYDLGLIPLYGKYDDRRSWIKTLEYTLMGIPWIGTKMTPTEELKNYGTRIKNTESAWINAIEDAIVNYNSHMELVSAGFDYAMAQDSLTNAPNIIHTYEVISDNAK